MTELVKAYFAISINIDRFKNLSDLILRHLSIHSNNALEELALGDFTHFVNIKSSESISQCEISILYFRINLQNPGFHFVRESQAIICFWD